jgi:hypothetical protein
MEHSPCNDIILLKRLLLGNGTKGWGDKVDDHEAFIQKLRGGLYLLGFIGITNVVILIKLFARGG